MQLLAYGKFRNRGFEILGVSLDRPDAMAALRQFMAEQRITWPQIYDGKAWKADIAVTYSVDSIPNPLLVDGTTGRILAQGDVLRGASLDSTLTRVLAGQT